MRHSYVAVLFIVLTSCLPGRGNSQTELEKVLYVNPQLIVCPDNNRLRCLQIKETFEGPWQAWEGDIAGFDYQEGFDYVLKVRQSQENGKSSYRLLGVLSKVVVSQGTNDASAGGSRQRLPSTAPQPTNTASTLKTTKQFYIAPDLIVCPDDSQNLCLKVRENPEAPWQPFAPKILGFDYQEGFNYLIKVEELTEGQYIIYTLLEVIEKTP